MHLIKIKQQIGAIFLLLTFLFGCTEYEKADFYIDPNRSDNNPGTEAQPFATIAKAQQAVRDSIKEGMNRDIIIHLRGGNHQLA